MTYSDKVSLRVAFGNALARVGSKYPDLHVLDAGTKNSTMSQAFEKEYPDRFVTPGINEPGMMALATGIAMEGKRVVACDMSVFLHHAYAQIRAAVRQGNLHMVIAASHTGIAVGPDGGSAHDLTDLARMRLIPYINVITPWDGNQIDAAVDAIMETPGFYYVRLNRPSVPIFTKENQPFEIGKAHKLIEGNKITLIAVGDKTFSAMEVAEQFAPGEIEVIGISTLEPIDQDTIVESATKTGKVVTIEDHMRIGGLYETVAGILARRQPTLMRSVSLERKITTSGEPDELAKLYGLTTDDIVRTCKEFLEE